MEPEARSPRSSRPSPTTQSVSKLHKNHGGCDISGLSDYTRLVTCDASRDGLGINGRRRPPPVPGEGVSTRVRRRHLTAASAALPHSLRHMRHEPPRQEALSPNTRGTVHQDRRLSDAESGTNRHDASRRTPLIAQPSVRSDEPRRPELETAATGAQRPGVNAVVADRQTQRSKESMRKLMP